MREAMGGSLLLYMIIPILFLFVAFIGFIMNYASTYRAANYIITQIETCDGDLSNCDNGFKSVEEMEQFAKKKFAYHGPIEYYCEDNAKGSVHKVALGVSIELPLIGKVPSSGNLFNIVSETKTIYNVFCKK